MEVGNMYQCVTSVQEIRQYIGENQVVAFDFETAPDEAFRDEAKAALDPHKSHIVGCSFSVQEGTGIYVPIAHLIGKNINKKEFFTYLKEFLTSQEIIKIAHNIAFESAQAYHRGIVIQAPVYDTICAAQMTLKNNYEFRTLQDSGLKTLAMEICGEPLPSFSDVTGGRHFDELDGQDAETVRYGAADSDFALRLYYKFNSWFDNYLPAHRRMVEKLESPTAVYIGIMRHNGLPMDVPLMEQKKVEVETELEKIREQICFIIGDVDIGANCSTQAFKNYLYETSKLPVLRTTTSNQASMDDITMQMLKSYCDGYRPELSQLFILVQKLRKLGKIKATFIDGYRKYLHEVTQRIHPDMLALSTETGRFSCAKPNCQNMPRKTNDPIGIRNFVKAPEGKVILSLDFSQIELRVGAFYCRDENMIQTYREDGDIHAKTTAVIYEISYDEARDKNAADYKERRTIAKNCNFGVFYGLFPKGLQNTLKHKAEIEKTLEECEKIIENLKNGYRNLAVWQAQTKADAYKKGYTETWLGRRRYLPDIRSKEWSKKSFAERCSMNTPIQGTAADILKLAIARILNGLDERPWLEPILQIHDELVFMVPEEQLDEAVAFVKDCMEEKPFPEFDLPLVAEAAVGQNFGEMEELED